MSDTLEQALDLLRAGDPHGGEVLVMEPLVRALARQGPRTRSHARASADVGRYLVARGDFDRALESLAVAVAVEPTTEDEVREQVGWYAAHAELLIRRDRPADALPWLQRAYGAATVGFGGGHERTTLASLDLADLMLRSGTVDEGVRELTGRALLLGWGRRDDRSVRALVLYGLAHGPDDTFELHADSAPAALRERVPDAVLAVAHTHPPAMVLPLVVATHARWAERRGDTDPRAIDLLVALSHLAHDVGDLATVVVSRRALVEVLGRSGRVRERVDALLGLADAVDDAGDAVLADAVYAEARTAALGDDATEAAVALSEGRRLVAAGRTAEAAKVLGAVSRGPHGGRAAMSLGLALAHAGDAGAAVTVLREAARRLDDDGDEAKVVRYHLAAAEQGRPCGCEPVGEVLTFDVRQRLTRTLPDLPVEDVVVALVEGTPRVQLRVGRAPTPDEKRRVERALRDAVAAWRKRASA